MKTLTQILNENNKNIDGTRAFLQMLGKTIVKDPRYKEALKTIRNKILSELNTDPGSFYGYHAKDPRMSTIGDLVSKDKKLRQMKWFAEGNHNGMAAQFYVMNTPGFEAHHGFGSYPANDEMYGKMHKTKKKSWEKIMETEANKFFKRLKI